MASYVVTCPGVQIIAGSRGFLLERGAVVPEGVDEATLARLEARGYIAAVDEDEPEPEPEPDPDPDTDPLEEMTVAEIEELAKAEGVDLTGASKKADKVAAINAARESASEPTEPADAGSNL